jgi:ADP-ribose pyrophosphatase YjhB (NUDIX family)
MGMSDHVRRLRALIGTELIILPSVAVLVRDKGGRVLLVRHADSGRWGLIGGAVEVDERPEDAAVRETKEEAGVEVALTRLVAVLGGPEFRVTYPNGDRTAYVSAVYEARVSGGRPRPDGDETVEVAWFAPEELSAIDLGPFARATFEELDWLRPPLL